MGDGEEEVVAAYGDEVEEEEVVVAYGDEVEVVYGEAAAVVVDGEVVGAVVYCAQEVVVEEGANAPTMVQANSHAQAAKLELGVDVRIQASSQVEVVESSAQLQSISRVQPISQLRPISRLHPIPHV